MYLPRCIYSCGNSNVKIHFDYFSDILRLENMNADAIYVRGMCLYYDDNIDKAFQHFQQVLRLAPDHQKAKTTYRVSERKFKRMRTIFIQL